MPRPLGRTKGFVSGSALTNIWRRFLLTRKMSGGNSDFEGLEAEIGRLTAPGVIGFYTRFEITEILAFRDGDSTQFVPPDSTMQAPWNRVLKNNFWSGSYVLASFLKWFSISKLLIQNRGYSRSRTKTETKTRSASQSPGQTLLAWEGSAPIEVKSWEAASHPATGGRRSRLKM